MDLIFIHGPAAVGKLTVGRALAARTGLPLFHNHLVVDALLAVFPFGSPAFVALRERMWLDVFAAAAEAGTSLIFTFAPEATVSPGFPGAVVDRIVPFGGRVRFIALVAPEGVQEARVAAASRQAMKKLVDVDLLRRVRAQGAFAYPALPAEITIDTSELPADEAAARIAGHLGLAPAP